MVSRKFGPNVGNGKAGLESLKFSPGLEFELVEPFPMTGRTRLAVRLGRTSALGRIIETGLRLKRFLMLAGVELGK